MRATSAIVTAALVGAIAFPCAAQQAEPVPPAVNPAIATYGIGTGNTSAATSNAQRSLSLDATSLTSISSYLATPYGVAAAATPSYTPATPTAVPGLNPAAPTLQSTIGTIETGAASSLPRAGSGRPLNMAPVGVALNSDLGGTVVASADAAPVPAAQAMGAGPAPQAMPARAAAPVRKRAAAPPRAADSGPAARADRG